MGSKELERAVQETVMLIHVWGRTSSACFWWGHRNHALGERLNGIQEVSGSIPLISTKRLAFIRQVSFLLKREAFVYTPPFW